jgi:hypothetical protein
MTDTTRWLGAPQVAGKAQVQAGPQGGAALGGSMPRRAACGLAAVGRLA